MSKKVSFIQRQKFDKIQNLVGCIAMISSILKHVSVRSSFTRDQRYRQRSQLFSLNELQKIRGLYNQAYSDKK